MNEPTIVSKTTSKGQTLEFRLQGYEVGSYGVAAYLDGRYVAGGRPCPLSKSPAPEITHSLGGKVGLTTAEAATLQAAIDAATQAWQESAAGMARQLRAERWSLVAAIAGALEDGERAYWQAHDQERVDGYALKAQHEAEAERYRQQLAAFDAAHPEVVAEINARRAADAERMD